MKKISLVAASVLALGWASAKAETGTSASAGVDVNMPAATDTARTPAAASPTTVSTPNATVTAPPGSTTTIKTPAAGAGATATTTSPSDPNAAVPGDLPAAPTTNVEINTPPAGAQPADPNANANANGATNSADTDNTVVVPAPVQPAPVQPVTVPQDNRYVERQYGAPAETPRIGAAFLVGGGFQDFSRSNIRDVTGQGGYWNARLIFGTRQFVGFEAAYVGSARDINALGLSSNAMLISNGAEGVLRINVPIALRGDALIEPFAFGGAGWSRYHVSRSSTNTSDIAPNDDVLEVPYGAGLAFSAAHFMADARFTYRSSFYDDLLRTTGGRLDNWSAGGQIGFEF